MFLLSGILLTMFIINVSLLFLHEMDAIRCKEWRMFFLLNRLEEETAYRVFAFAHLPLYMALIAFLMLGFEKNEWIAYIIADVFMMAHSLIHMAFTSHRGNGFINGYSKAIVHSMGILSFIHIILLWRFI